MTNTDAQKRRRLIHIASLAMEAVESEMPDLDETELIYGLQIAAAIQIMKGAGIDPEQYERLMSRRTFTKLADAANDAAMIELAHAVDADNRRN